MPNVTKLTPENVATMLALVRICVPISTAAMSVGISYSTIKAWRADARENPETSRYTDFSNALDEAVAEAEIAMVRTIHTSASSDPRSAQWMLERRFQGKWSPASKTKVDATVKHSGLDVSGLSQEERDAMRALLTKATKTGA
jgi:hypothetical protein